MMMCIQNLVGFCQFVLKILSGNEILTSIKGRNSVKTLRKMTGNNPKLDLVNVDVQTKNLVGFCEFVLKILSRNEILTSIKGRNSVKILRKMKGNNSNLDLVKMMCILNFVGFCQFVLKILSGNEILTLIKGRNSVKFLRKMTGNNPKLDLVNVDVHTKFGRIQ